MRTTHRMLLPLALTLSAATPALSADAWGIEGEKEVLIEGKVVDLLCELAGDCAADCGAGTRQLGILDKDGRLYPAAKGNVFFAGATVDLLPHCGKPVTVDGLLIESPRMPILFVQSLKGEGDAELKPATAFQTDWTARNGDAPEWFRADPTIKAVIEADGVFGIKGLKPSE